MRVIGIDPGSNCTGYGIIDHKGGLISHLENGGIRPDGKGALSNKLDKIYTELASVIETYRPDVAVIENLFFAKNARSSLLLGHARGVAMLAASQAGLKIAEYTPSEVKQAITGNGRATKLQIQHMVRVMLKLPQVAMEDASDALAIAICHCNASGLQERIALQLKR